MLRTQISLTEEERKTLDAEAARTGQSISSLIRQAVDKVYGEQRSAEEDIAVMRRSAGAWKGRRDDGKTYVEKIRTGARMARFE